MRWRSIALEQSFGALLIGAVITAGYAHVYDLSLVLVALLLCPGAAARPFGIAVAIYMWLAFLIAGSVPAASLLWPCLSPPLAAYAVSLLFHKFAARDSDGVAKRNSGSLIHPHANSYPTANDAR
jgi:hypothetical protein